MIVNDHKRRAPPACRQKELAIGAGPPLTWPMATTQDFARRGSMDQATPVAPLGIRGAAAAIADQ